jgi:zinc transport system ATP-binding protein
VPVTGAEGGPVLDVEAARVALGGRPVLHGVDVHVAPGEMVALLGANGSGKSTLVRAVVGLVPLAGGEVRLFGTPLPRFRGWGRVGYVPQRVTAASGVPASVREVVEAGRLAGRGLLPGRRRDDRAAVAYALDLVGLADRAQQPVHTLSGGQQQRVLVARALVGEPDLLLLDEPMAGVDAPSQETFAAALTALRASGSSALLVAHELGPLERLVDRAVVLRHGRVAYEGAPPPALGHHAVPGHDHVHPHTGEPPDETGWLR